MTLQRDGVWNADAALPGDNFVNPLFNTVVLIALGIVSVKSRQLACLICCIAVGMLLGSTWERDNAFTTALWRTVPASAITPDDVYQFLMLSLVRWVASAIVAAFNMRWIVSLLTPSTLKFTLHQKWLFILFFCVSVFFRGQSEFHSFKDISNDWGLIFHFLLAQVMDTARAAFQVVLLFQPLSTSTKRGKIAVAHMFVLSTLTLAQNLLSYGLRNPFLWIDILLQLHVMKKTSRAYDSFVNLILSIPASLQFPPYDDNYVTEDLVEAIAPTILSLLPTAGSEDLVADTTAQNSNSVHIGGDLNIHPHHHDVPLDELGDIFDEDFIDTPLATFECIPQLETSNALRPPPKFVPSMLPTMALQCLHSECVP